MAKTSDSVHMVAQFLTAKCEWDDAYGAYTVTTPDWWFGSGDTPQAAWASAAQRIKEKA